MSPALALVANPPDSDAATIDRYRRLAGIYDDRWRCYNERTLTEALDGLQLSGTKRILDVGCGTGELERLALARFHAPQIVGIDLSPTMLAIARVKLAAVPSVRFEVAHAEALPFEPDTFHVVICASMLHHATQPDQVVQECARVLRPSGQLVLVDWCWDFWRNRLMHWWLQTTDRTYSRMLRADEMQCLLTAEGLVIERVSRFIAPPAYGMMRIVAKKPSENEKRSR